MNIPSISLETLLFKHDPEDVLSILSDAEIIIGRDLQTNEVFIVVGQDVLEKVLGNPAHDPVNVIMIDLVRRSDDLAQLTELIKTAKGA